MSGRGRARQYVSMTDVDDNGSPMDLDGDDDLPFAAPVASVPEATFSAAPWQQQSSSSFSNVIDLTDDGNEGDLLFAAPVASVPEAMFSAAPWQQQSSSSSSNSIDLTGDSESDEKNNAFSSDSSSRSSFLVPNNPSSSSPRQDQSRSKNRLQKRRNRNCRICSQTIPAQDYSEHRKSCGVLIQLNVNNWQHGNQQASAELVVTLSGHNVIDSNVGQSYFVMINSNMYKITPQGAGLGFSLEHRQDLRERIRTAQ